MAAVVVAATAASAVSVLVAGPASAAPAWYTGQLCYANGKAPFYDAPGGNYDYTVQDGGGIRIEGTYARDYNGTVYLYGHGNGHSNDWFRKGDTTC